MRKRFRIAVFTVVLLGIVLMGFRYFDFVSKIVYEESVSHLTEVFHQSDNMLRELTNKNLTYLHMWGENLQNTYSEDEIRDHIKKAQEDAGFLDFFFLSADGNYKMVTGETGYLGLQENIEEDIRQGNDVIANAAVPGRSQMLVFATPKAHGTYQGFEYDAIAIAYENSDIVDVLNISAFNGNAQSFVVHPDGRVVVDHSSESWGNVYNFFGVLREHSNMSEKEVNELSEKFKAGRTDAMLVNLDERNYYLVYEKSDIQDWVFLGLVQADIVNASMNSLQRSTMLLVAAVLFCIAAFFIGLIIQKNRISLRRKDTQIRYRDELFQKLSMNVDDVFLMLDAKTYQADYISPNAEKLLGITVEQIRKDIYILEKLHPEEQEALASIMECRRVDKGELLLEEGRIARHFHYVESGMLRQYYYKNGHDITEHFSCEDDLVFCIISLFRQEPTRLMIEAIEPTVVYDIPYTGLQELFVSYSSIAQLYKKILEWGLMVSQNKADSWRFETAKERYKRFLKDFPEAAKRAPISHIASYLLMTPETLSRVRAEIFQE